MSSSAPTNGTLSSTLTYWGDGRLQRQRDYAADGTTQIHDRQDAYNAKGQLTQQFISTKKNDGKTYTANTTNDYGTDANYALGAVVSSTSYNTVVNQSASTSSTVNTFQWWDAAVQSSSAYDADTASSSNQVYHTSHTYNALGQLTQVSIQDGKPRTATFSLDELGQVIRRDETTPSNPPPGQTGSPHEVWYRFAGREFGFAGNNGDTGAMDHAASIQDRQYAPPANQGTFRAGRTIAEARADFAQGPEAINSYAQGSVAGSYTVRGGESLQQIAQTLWGDAGLWYKLAEANGLSASATLNAGTTLVLPAGVTRNTNSAQTFKPYRCWRCALSLLATKARAQTVAPTRTIRRDDPTSAASSARVHPSIDRGYRRAARR